MTGGEPVWGHPHGSGFHIVSRRISWSILRSNYAFSVPGQWSSLAFSARVDPAPPHASAILSQWQAGEMVNRRHIKRPIKVAAKVGHHGRSCMFMSRRHRIGPSFLDPRDAAKLVAEASVVHNGTLQVVSSSDVRCLDQLCSIRCGSISEFLGFPVLGRVATSDLASTCCPGGKDDAGEFSRRVPCLRCTNRPIYSEDITC